MLHMSRIILSVLFSFIFTFGFTQTGNIKGVILDTETGEPLGGVTIFVIGTYKGGFSDQTGKFEINDVKEGDYSIRFSFLGYAEKMYNGVQIVSGKTKDLEVKMSSAATTLGEVEIVGQRTLIDLESGQSTTLVSEEEIGQMTVKNVQEIVSMQVGVNETPDGIQIRGGRVYETAYLVDGISAQDPLAGTGFGIDVNASAIKNVEVITGGSGAEYGNGSSGVILTRIKEGSQSLQVNAKYYRDNLGFNVNQGPSWNTDEANISLSGPVPATKGKATFFLSGSAFIADEYYRSRANQLHSSLFTNNDSLWAPRQDNRWSNTVKLSVKLGKAWKLNLTNQHSLNINQSTRSLQIIGNDEVIRPGFQYRFSLDMDQANTYTHHSNLSIIGLKGLLNERWSSEFTVGRLFTNLRADANGRPFRTESVDQVFDPQSIVTAPIDIVNPGDSIVFVLPGPGLVNNGGIATLWHDHFVQEYTAKAKFNYSSKNKTHYMVMGLEHKEQTYQWIDITRPWVGAPIRINDTLTTPSSRLGSSSDFWRANPATGGLFFSDEIRYKGIIANLGFRFNYWAYGKFVDEAINDPSATIVDATREAYLDQTVPLFGRRWKARLLPKVNVSFPVTENNVLYFNYSHSMKMAHPRFIYAGLDPVFQDRSFLSNLGNPNINPEVTVGYEIGLKSQLTKDLGLTVTAYSNDKFDYIVSRRILVKDPTGRFVSKSFFVNQDYARVQGIEVALTRRIGDWFSGNISLSYSRAAGQSNSAAESAQQIEEQGFVNTSKELPLAWDRPIDLKTLLIFTPNENISIGNVSLKGFRMTVSATYKSGLRYTPFVFVRFNEDTGRPEYERDDTQRFGKTGSPWFWANAKLSRDFFIGENKKLSLSVELTNLTNYRSAAIVNGVTGRAYELGDPLPFGQRDPLFPTITDSGLPPFNPARYLAPRHTRFGLELAF